MPITWEVTKEVQMPKWYALYSPAEEILEDVSSGLTALQLPKLCPSLLQLQALQCNYPGNTAGNNQEAGKCYGYGKCLHSEEIIGGKAGYCN